MKNLIASLILILFPVCGSSLTLSELRTDTRVLVNDALSSPRQRFSNTNIDSWVNEGQRIADIKTLCYYKAFTFQLSTGTTYYAMPTDYMLTRRVTRDYLSIQEMTPAGLDGRSAEWENQSGLPTYYFLNFSSRTKIGFAPFPMLVTDTATIKVEYMAYSPTLTNTTDVPFNSIVEFYPYHYILSYYAAYKASIVDERYDKAKLFLDSYSATVDLMKERCVSRPNYTPQMIGKQ